MVKPKKSKAERLEFAKRMTRRFVPGIHCYKMGPKQYWVKRRGWGFNAYKVCGFGSTALAAWESALRHWMVGVVSSMWWRVKMETISAAKEVYFGFAEADADPQSLKDSATMVRIDADALAIKQAPDVSIIGIDEWVEDMNKKSPAK